MAVYKVSKSGSNTSPYDTWVKAATTIQTAITAAANAGDVVEINVDTYTENLDTKHSGASGNPIIIKASEEAGHSGWVIVDFSALAGDEGLEGTHDYITWEGIHFIGSETLTGPPGNTIYVQDGGSHWIFSKCIVDIGYRLAFYDAVGKEVLFEFCKIRVNGYFADEMIYLEKSTVTFNYCIFTPNESECRRIKLMNGGNAILQNCILAGFRDNIFRSYNAGAAGTIKNCIIMSHDLGSGSGEERNIIDDAAGGTFVFDYNHWLPSVWVPGNNIGITDGGHSITDSFSKVTNLGRNKGYICYCVDDGSATGLAYAKEIKTVCNTKNVKFIFGVDQKRMLDQADYAAEMQSFVADGHEIAAHSYSHTSMLATFAFRVQGTGTSPTVDIDYSGDQIICHDTETGNNIVSGFKAKTIDVIMAEINAFANFNAANKWDSYMGVSKGEILLDTGGGQNCSSQYDMLLDKRTDCSQGFFKLEVADVKAWIESTIGSGYVCKTFIYPGGGCDQTVMNALSSAGFLGGRAGHISDLHPCLQNLEIFYIQIIDQTQVYPNKTENDIKFSSTSVGCMGMIKAELFSFCTHSSTDFTAEQFGWLIDGFKEIPNIEITTFAVAFDHIRTSGHWADADGDGQRWTRTFVDDSNYHLMTGSPCIDTGLDLGLTEDFEGNSVPMGTFPDIGAYESMAGWAGRIMGVINSAKIMGIDVGNINKITGIS
jgi:hypothetical protein